MMTNKSLTTKIVAWRKAVLVLLTLAGIIGLPAVLSRPVTLWRTKPIVPKHVELVSEAGQRLGSFFEGLTPTPRYVGIRSHVPPTPGPCGKASGLFSQVTDFLGITATVYAQMQCEANLPCASCEQKILDHDCSGFACGTYNYSESGGFDDEGTTFTVNVNCPNCQSQCQLILCQNKSCP